MNNKTILFILLSIGVIFIIYKTDKYYKKKKKILLIKNPKIKEIDNISNVYMDIKIKDKISRIEIQLFDDNVPKTARNFRFLCKQGLNGGNSPYIGTKFFRVIKDYMIQGGDIESNNGSGGYSIYGKYFDDECFDLQHNQQGLIAMVNKEKNKNNSQFMILTKKNGVKSFNNRYVVFGIILKGYNIINDIQNVKVNNKYKPLNSIKIVDCGVITKEEDITLSI